MAESTVLERTTEKDAVKTARTGQLSAKTAQIEEVSEAERLHNERRKEYLKLLYPEEESEVQATTVAAAPAIAAQRVAEEYKPHATPASAAQRLADYTPHVAPASNHTLFEGLAYKDGELISDVAVMPAPAAAAEVYTAPAPTASLEFMPAVVYAPAEAEEDALPTQRTMNTLRKGTAEVQTAQRTGLFAGISARAKVVLAAIVFAIVMAITIICVNTGIINRLDASIETLREEVAEEQMKYEALEQEKNRVINDEEAINQFAEEHGMIRS